MTLPSIVGSSWVSVIVNVSSAVNEESLTINFISLTNSVIGVPETVVLPLKVKSTELNYSQ